MTQIKVTDDKGSGLGTTSIFQEEGFELFSRSGRLVEFGESPQDSSGVWC